MEYLNTDSLMMPILTGWVTLSSWPRSEFFADLGKYELWRYLCLFILIYQGQGQANITLSAVATLVFYVVIKVVDMLMAKRSEGYY